MTIDEAIKALSRGCCSRERAAETGCEKCVAKYAAIDWMRCEIEAQRCALVAISAAIACEQSSDSARLELAEAHATLARAEAERNAYRSQYIDEVNATGRLREIERLAHANYKASACLDQVTMDEPECGECGGCKLRAALEAKT